MAPRIRMTLLAASTALLTACGSPLYVWDTHTTSTPRTRGLELAEVGRQPVAVLPVVAPGALQGFSASVSHALVRTLPELTPPLSALATPDVVNVVNTRGLAADYADLLGGFGRGGILERERLGRLGTALDCRYALLPGITAFDHSLLDRFEMFGVKIVRTRVLVLRLWLQLWDTRTGELVWESAGEGAVVTELANSSRVIAVDEVAQKIWKRMLEDGLVAGKLSSRAPIPSRSVDLWPTSVQD
jgi:hypothetical protein